MKLVCEICDTDAVIHIGETQGYKFDSTYSIFACQACGTGFASPGAVDERIYDAIYKNVEKIPGYSRYAELAREILRQKDPLSYIMGVDDCYYGIAKTLIDKIETRNKSLICEVGCGQGYLTYALTSAGYNAIGIDISSRAIELAQMRYGNNYHFGNLRSFVAVQGKKPSYIISSEVIEHLSDPVTFVSEMLDFLAPGGALILTTPNRLTSDNKIWDTELPPVHLWHFSKTGLIELAKKLDSQIEFVDLTAFYTKHPKFRSKSESGAKSSNPILDSSYNLLSGNEVKRINSYWKELAKKILPLQVVTQIQKMRIAHSDYYMCEDATSLSLCAIITREY